MKGLIHKAWKHWRQEHRLPGLVSNSPLAVLPRYLLFRLGKILHALFPGNPPGCLVVFPITQIRYRYHLLYLLSLVYPRILVFWNARLRDLCELQTEGRYIFRLPGVRFANEADLKKWAERLEGFDLVRAAGSPVAPPEKTRRLFEIDTNLADEPAPDSYLIPYCPHPQNFRASGRSRPENSSEGPRPVRVFFSGNVEFVKDPELVRRLYGIPSRDSTVAYLRETFPHALWLESLGQRDRWRWDQERRPLVFATAKGDPRRWLRELEAADFFLCLPGSHMPMCHNAIEAMMSGAIPILAYDTWFSPHLREGTECLTYRDLAGLRPAIERALSMKEESVREMRRRVRDYYHKYLDLPQVARRIFGPANSRRRLRLYLNQEDCGNFGEAGARSVLLNGGSLQSEIDEPLKSGHENPLHG